MRFFVRFIFFMLLFNKGVKMALSFLYDYVSQVWSHDLLYEMVPSVLQPLTPITVQAGDTAILTCRICGRPRPDIKWTFQNTNSLEPGQRFQITSNDDGFVSLAVSNYSSRNARQ